MSGKSVIGVDLDGKYVRVGKVKNDQLIDSYSFKISFNKDETFVLKEVVQSIDKVFSEEVSGIGIGVPSLVDVEQGIVYNVKNIPSWKEVHLKEKLEKQFKVPIYVNNDANCFAVGEKYFGEGKKYKNIVALIISRGMGAGIIIDNKLNSGASCGAGEFGKIPYKEKTYEYYCSDHFFYDEHKTTVDKLLKKVEQKDKEALDIFTQFGNHLGNAILTILNAVDPEIIILGGSLIRIYSYFQEAMWEKVKLFPYKHTIENLKIEISKQEEIAILGAAALYYDAQEAKRVEIAEEKRKQAEEALRQERNLLRAIMDNIPDNIYFKDTQCRLTNVNKAMANWFGLKDTGEILGKSDFDLFTKEHAQQAYDDEQKIMTTGKPLINFEEKETWDDGSETWVSTSKVPLIDENGKSIGIIGISRDITERKRIEQEVQRRATQATLLYETGQKLSSELDIDSLLFMIVNAVCDSFNYYGVMLLLPDGDGKIFSMRSIAGGYKSVFSGNLKIKLGEGIIGKAASLKKIQVCGDVSKSRNYIREGNEKTKSELAVPIMTGKKVIGVLDIQSDRLNAFDKLDVSAMQTLSTQIASAIDNARLYNQAQQEIADRKRAESKLRESRDSLEKAKKETDNILQNVEEGLFLLNSEFKIGSQYSTALENIFSEKSIAQKRFLDILKNKIDSKVLSSVEEYLDLMFSNEIDEITLNDLNPLANIEFIFNHDSELPSESKFLTFKFQRILANKNTLELIATVNDITEQVQLSKKLEESKKQSKRQMEWLLSILHIEPQLLKDFIESSQTEFKEVAKAIKNEKNLSYDDILKNIYRSVHLIKGNASLLDLTYFAEKAHQCEDSISRIQKKEKIDSNDFISINFKLDEMRKANAEINAMIEKISEIHSHFRPKRTYEGEKLIKSIDNFVKHLIKDSNKNVQFKHKDFDIMSVPHNYRLLVKDILIQLVRNAVYHGIEENAEREQMKKGNVATIELRSEVTKEMFQLFCRDDGRGLQLNKLRQKAKEIGKWEEKEIDTWSDERVSELIFESGISTADKTDMTAGRGVGMDIILDKVKRNNGKININFKEGEYCEFSIFLPLK